MLRHSRLAKKSRRCGLNNEFEVFAPFIEPMSEIARVFFKKLPKSGLMGDTNSPDPLKKGSDAQTFGSHALNPNFGDIERKVTALKQNGVEPRSNKGTNNEA